MILCRHLLKVKDRQDTSKYKKIIFKQKNMLYFSTAESRNMNKVLFHLSNSNSCSV